MVPCKNTFLLVEPTPCIYYSFSSILASSALKILEISKSLRHVYFLNHLSSEKYHFKCYQWTEFNVCLFLSGLWGKVIPLRPPVVWTHLRGLPFNYQRRFSGCSQEKSCHKITITYHKNRTESCGIWKSENSTKVFWILKLVVFESYEWLHRTDLSSELYFHSCCQIVLVHRRKFPTTHASSDKILTELLEKLCAAAHFLALDTPKTNMLLGLFLSTVAELTILVCIYSVKSWICILVDIPCLSVGGKNNTVGVCVCVAFSWYI